MSKIILYGVRFLVRSKNGNSGFLTELAEIKGLDTSSSA
ncbi:hypothetical protein LTSESEN_5656 [Salmonella enterica subsp. enterica serovar Senftenberg str. A4-543]|uniref:Uncharacterized protein n=1 Tax=Salmonella enterica subsp. enterica serovar Senftenberg str. A4-543 TaxID=913082 RepID=G5R7F1_SALSE|nr:hypothetical protein LTSESEN_5656 [Salmonella enterica subsp. enterica serovar Senftenberg str. A4-543]